MVGFELLPFGLVGVGDDDRVDVNQAMPPGRRHDFFLGRGDHAVEIFDLVFKYFDELDQPAVADVERAVQFQDPRIAFGIKIQFGNIFAADQHRGVLIVGVDRRHHADADPRAFGKLHRADRKFLVLAGILLNEFVAAHRAEVALDVHAEHFFKLFAQMARNQVQAALRTSGSPRWHKTVRFPRGRDGVFRPASFCPSRPVPSGRAPGGSLRL